MLDSALDIEPGAYTYPPHSPVINARHFYQNTVLMDWVRREPRPVSLRQLAFFGRKLNEEKLVASANFVRVELPVRIAHRIRDMQILPYAVVSNSHLCDVYEKYYAAFDKFRKFPKIHSLEDNERFCRLLDELLNEHLSVIPNLVMGVIENSIASTTGADVLDQFMAKVLCSRISRRVIAEQHLALTQAYNRGARNASTDPSYIGEVFLQCSAKQTIEDGAEHAKTLIRELYPDAEMPKIEIEGHVDTTFPYIKSHLDYIIGEIMRNSIEATVAQQVKHKYYKHPPPIVVSISNTPQNVLFRISDQGGGVPEDVLPHIWSFAHGPRKEARLQNFQKVPTFAGLPNEVGTYAERNVEAVDYHPPPSNRVVRSSLSSLAARNPQLKLGMGLPLSRIYAEYWDGALELQSLEGYGTDVFLRISRLGNQNEKLQLDRV
ncbi:[Pyruvate dehydrogenase (acetyl-transferring)] kinase 2, mitochondrial [Trichomonascus vanleenenianus]|uniref:protein kinase PKP2 n=1 Tax=Trichomonascus vanleenenianus TaxID=2268995 RepID=UPI003ECB5E01